MANLELYSLVTPGLLAVLGFFLHRLLKNFDQVSDKFTAMISEVALIKGEVARHSGLPDKLQALRDDVKDAEAEIVILQRDQATIWRNIDNLKEHQCKES